MAFARRLFVLLAFAAGVFAPAAHAAPFISMYFNPPTIDIGGESELELNIYDISGAIVGGGAVSFTYPAGVVNGATAPTTLNCGAAVVNATPGLNSVIVTTITILNNQVCTIRVHVTSAVPAVYTVAFPAGAFSGSTGLNSTTTSQFLAVTPPLVVTTTLDTGPGSLRQVIQDSKDYCTSSPNIRFNIPGPGPHTIQPPTELPSLTCNGTTINGYSQPGASVNTKTDGTNDAVIKIAINGSLCSGCNRALTISGGYTMVAGLAIHSFPFAHIDSTGQAQIMGNYIGTDPAGMTALGGQTGIRVIQGGAAIGHSSDPGLANLITGHQKGVVIEDANANIDGNLIGGNRAGTSGVANSVAGVWIMSLSNGTYASNNYIRYNGGPGIAVEPGTVSRNRFLANAMSGNTGPGIDLNVDGPTPNDEASFPFDEDSGPNGLTNYAVLTHVTHVGGNTVLEGYIKTECCDGSAEIDFYHNSAIPPAGITQGERPIGSLNVQLDEFGFAAFTHTIAGFLAQNVSTTALVDYCGDGCEYSSEYSPTYAVGGSPAAPTIVGLRLTNGSVGGGSTVAIVGSSLATVSSVTIGGVPGIIELSGLTLWVRTPAHAAGPVNVVVTSPSGSGMAAGAFNYTNNDDVARDFSLTGNPGPRWSYGWAPTRGGTFTPYPTHARNLLDDWSSGGSLPNLGHNSSDDYVSQPTYQIPPGTVVLHPGAAGENSVARWTAPAAGTYHIVGAFTGYDFMGPTTTDVAVLRNNNAATPLFTGSIADWQIPLAFMMDVTVAAGDTIEFTVGDGGNGNSGDATGLDATISPTAALAPAVTFTPPSLNYPARAISSTSPPQTVTVTNDGPGTLAISSITISGDFAFVSACPASLPVDGTCTIDVTFTPLVAGLRNGTLNVVSNAGGSPHAVPLAGTGQGGAVAVLEISPSILDFAPQALDSESPVQIVTLGNSGTAVLAFGPLATNVDFAIRPVPPPAAGAAPRPPGYVGPCDIGLAPGETCDVAIAFRPTAEGLREGVLSISSNATQQSATVRLVGTGIVGVPPRTLSIAESVVFGSQAVGTRSAESTLTISNNSAAAVAITELTATGDFGVSEGCAVVAARGTCTLLLTFRPLALGERTGNLAIRTLSELDPYNVSLAGTGVFNPLPALEVSVTRVGFGNALLGSATSVAVDLVNVGQVEVALGAISATGAFLASHACGAVLAVGATCPVQVGFFPRMRGPQVGVLEVASNAGGNPHRVELSGTGCALPSIARSRLRPVLCAP